MREKEKNNIPVITTETFEGKHFVALDGEAIDGKYVLLGTSHPSYCLEDRQGIKTDDALDFLFRLGHNRQNRAKGTVYVGYFFGYDVEMICRDLPANIKRRLFRPRFILTKKGTFIKDRVFYKNWELTYIKRKFFSIKRKGAQYGITIYEASGFFTGFPKRSFVAVLEQMKFDVPEEIREGKLQRGHFVWSNYPTIKAYNNMELKLLVQLMQKIYSLADVVDLVPRRWYGASALGNLALSKWKIRDYMRRTVQHNMSNYFWGGITRAYFGGRIEAFKLGTFEDIHAYDINSAYPAAIALLPCTRDNHFVYTKRYRKTFALWHIRYKFPKTLDVGMFPFRLNDGSIKFPLSGEGWYWNPEVDLAVKHWSGCIEIIEGYYIQDAKKETPLQTLFPRLYKERKNFKKAGNDAHYILKIVLNSIYGKFAQKVGRADFLNFTWAGWITSYTRAKMREAVIGNEKHIIAFSTDGIYSLKPLPLKPSDKLGGWDVSEFSRGTILMSGVYLLEGEGKPKTGERGYGALSDWQGILEQISERKVKGHFKDCLQGKQCNCRPQGSASVTVRLFVGFNMADNFPEEYGPDYLKFTEREKILNPQNLTKRKYHVKQIKDWTKNNCGSEPIGHLSGMSGQINTAIDFTTDDDLIFTEDGNEGLWMLKES